MNHYIKAMSGYITRARGYGQNEFELIVTVSFDAKLFNKIKKNENPLAAGMAQIKNVVFDAVGVRGVPSYAPISMNQRYPRAVRGLITLELSFSIDYHAVQRLGADTKDFCLHHTVELNETLEKTRDDGHLFAKTAIAAVMGH